MDKRSYQDRKEYLQKYYRDYYHQPENKEKIKAKQRRQGLKNREKYLEWKSNLSCLICDESESCCLEFHHRDPNEKEFTISKISSKSLNFIQREAEKCVVLCSNCHKKVHAGIAQLVEHQISNL